MDDTGKKEVKDIKSILIRYGITTAVGALICLGVMAIRGFFSGENSELENLLALTDGFSVSGIMLTMIGLLVWATNHGSLDAIGFSFKILINVVTRKKDYPTYYEYKQQKVAKGNVKVSFLIHVGIVFLIIAIIFTLKYLQLDPLG